MNSMYCERYSVPRMVTAKQPVDALVCYEYSDNKVKIPDPSHRHQLSCLYCHCFHVFFAILPILNGVGLLKFHTRFGFLGLGYNVFA